MISNRRTFLLGAGFFVMGGARLARAETESQIRAIEKRVGGRIGVAMLDTKNGARLEYRASERFAMCSTFKWILAAKILSEADRGRQSLDTRITYGPKDMFSPNTVAPVTRAHLAEGNLSVAELCSAAVEESDNVAANLLLSTIGGPAGLTDFMRTQGDTVTRLDRNEPSLNTNIASDPRDTTTPAAMVGLMNRILVGDALAPASRERLIDWMKACHTGLKRLRAGMPSDWAVGDKTGTGENGSANDVAIAWPPNQPPLLVASYFSGSTLPVERLNEAHAEIGKIVACTAS